MILIDTNTIDHRESFVKFKATKVWFKVFVKNGFHFKWQASSIINIELISSLSLEPFIVDFWKIHKI